MNAPAGPQQPHQTTYVGWRITVGLLWMVAFFGLVYLLWWFTAPADTRSDPMQIIAPLIGVFFVVGFLATLGYVVHRAQKNAAAERAAFPYGRPQPRVTPRPTGINLGMGQQYGGLPSTGGYPSYGSPRQFEPPLPPRPRPGRCTECKGKGLIQQRVKHRLTDFSSYYETVTCPRCFGTGIEPESWRLPPSSSR